MNSLNKSRKKKQKKKRFIFSNTSIVLLTLVTIFLGYQVVGLQEKRNVSEEKRAEAEGELNRLVEEESSLRTRIEELQTLEGKEEAIRERFNVVKEGEGVIYIVEEDRAIGADIVLEEEKEKEGPIEWLKGLFAF